jgi:hypothetical protein
MPEVGAAALPSPACIPSRPPPSLALLLHQDLLHSRTHTLTHTRSPTACFHPLQVEEKVQDAVAKGASVACGGARPSWGAGSPLAGGFFYQPTVLTGACLPAAFTVPLPACCCVDCRLRALPACLLAAGSLPACRPASRPSAALLQDVVCVMGGCGSAVVKWLWWCNHPPLPFPHAG